MVKNIRKCMALYMNVTYAFYLNCPSNVENERVKEGILLFLSIGKNVDTPAVLHVYLARILHSCVCLKRIEKAGCATQNVETF